MKFLKLETKYVDGHLDEVLERMVMEMLKFVGFGEGYQDWAILVDSMMYNLRFFFKVSSKQFTKELISNMCLGLNDHKQI